MGPKVLPRARQFKLPQTAEAKPPDLTPACRNAKGQGESLHGKGTARQKGWGQG